MEDRLLSDGRHIVLADVDGPHHIWLPDSNASAPLAYAIARDAYTPLRHQVAARLDRRLIGSPPARKSCVHRPTPYQCHRLDLMLAILDLVATGGATTYQIARQLVYPLLTEHSSAEWKASSERRQVQRLVDEATRFMNGRYRALLAKGYPGRQK